MNVNGKGNTIITCENYPQNDWGNMFMLISGPVNLSKVLHGTVIGVTVFKAMVFGLLAASKTGPLKPNPQKTYA